MLQTTAISLTIKTSIGMHDFINFVTRVSFVDVDRRPEGGQSSTDIRPSLKPLNQS